MARHTHPFRVVVQFPEDELAQRFIQRVRASNVRRAISLALDKVFIKSHPGVPPAYRHLHLQVERLEGE